MINEAVFCVMEGVATPEAIDTVMKLGMAHPMGPLALADFIGLDVCLAILEVLHRGLGDDKYRPAPLLRQMVAAGYLGRKSGRGFYDYRGELTLTETAWTSSPSMHALRPRAGAAVARPALRLLRHHRDPRHHARPGARRHPLLAATPATEEAIIDALRLARGMTYKYAVAGINLGGGKSVIIGDNKRTDREALFRAHGRFVETLGGRYITAEDVGTSPADMEYITLETDHVAGLARPVGRSVAGHRVRRLLGHEGGGQGALGQRQPQRARRWRCRAAGNVGHYLCRAPAREGAKLIVTDIDAGQGEAGRERVRRRGGGAGRDLRPGGRRLRAVRARRHDQRRDDPAAQGRDRRRRRQQPAAEERHGDVLESAASCTRPTTSSTAAA